MKTKQELEQAIVMLEEQVVSNTSEMISVQADLKQATKDLADINKPVLTPLQLDNVQEAIESAVGNFDFDEADNYNKEFEIDYDGRVQLSHLEFENAQELIESIVEKVHKLFVEAPEELDTTEPDNHI